MYKVDVRFSDFDIYKHVNNAVYFSYLESARIDFFQRLLGHDWDWTNFGLILKKQTIEYNFPIQFSDIVYIEVSVLSIGNKSFELHYKVFNTDTVFALATTILVCYDYSNKSTINIPIEIKEVLNKLKNTK
jgi:acyl-CoA thioester hydrolase